MKSWRSRSRGAGYLKSAPYAVEMMGFYRLFKAINESFEETLDQYSDSGDESESRVVRGNVIVDKYK